MIRIKTLTRHSESLDGIRSHDMDSLIIGFISGGSLRKVLEFIGK